ncbi:MAG: FAD-binding oxidoreductase [Planctomycetia bacterium]|nr:FAD-binding oxidoreductase [Planctomycetia bacterium]
MATTSADPDVARRLALLGRSLDGALLLGIPDRAAYATDASEYQERPLAVALPRTDADVQALVRFAAAERIGIIPRGAGTSLAGQVVGGGIVVDLGRHMNRILGLDTAARRVRVQPGVVRNDLNRFLAPGNLHRLVGDDRRHGGEQLLRVQLDRLRQHPRSPRLGPRLPRRWIGGVVRAAVG